MSVIIGSARGDERGAITGGQAGDQTGKEVCTEYWYKSKLGWVLIRPKSPIVADRIAQDCEMGCANNKIGYDQSNNQSLWYEVEPYGWDCSKATKPCETDCSQFARVCISYALKKAVPYFYTGDMVEKLSATGEFDILTASKYTTTSDYLKRGDLLCTRTKGHTVIVLSDGAKAYKKVITEDGWWGKDTTHYLQETLNTPVDGIISSQYRNNKKYLKNINTNSWKFALVKPKGSTCIKALQRLIGADQDGICGMNTIKKLQEYLKKKAYYTGAIDGYLSYNTVLSLQKWINEFYKY